MKIQKRLREILLVTVMMFAAYWSSAATLSISTYYPSPYGSYQNLDSTDTTHLAATAGNVGIGVPIATVPAQKLDVQGGSAAISDIVGGAATTKAFIEGTNNVAYFGGLGTQRTSFGNSENWETLTADGGNIGIGTTAPAALLHASKAGGGTAAIAARIEGSTSAGTFTDVFGTVANRATLTVGTQYTAAAGAIFNAYNQGGSHLYIQAGGNIGMGNTAPAQTLDVTGNIHTSGTLFADSDSRFKTDIQPLTGTLPKLDRLRGVTYERNKQRELGVIGQELEKVFPELVTRTGKEEYRSVDYARLSVVLLEALKELQVRQDKMSKRIEELETQLRKK